ncbi:hypothetical protein C2E23DRAFT_782904, partial [Lenzites betulinus]
MCASDKEAVREPTLSNRTTSWTQGRESTLTETVSSTDHAPKIVKRPVTVEDAEDEDEVHNQATSVQEHRDRAEPAAHPARELRKPARWIAGRRWPSRERHTRQTAAEAPRNTAVNAEHDKDRYVGPDAEETPQHDLFELPVSAVFSTTDDADDIYTRTTEPFKPKRVQAIVDAIHVGEDVTSEERKAITQLIEEFADCFALSVKEVTPVPGAVHTLNVPADATFSKRVHQKPLTPPQREYVHKKIDELVEAGAIEPCTPDEVKCIAPITLAHKAH